MPCSLEYHGSVRHWIPASLLLSVMALLLFLVSSAYAQINGAPPSVTSPGFGGHAINMMVLGGASMIIAGVLMMFVRDSGREGQA